MSCQHGNWDGACGICEELDRQYELGKASARKEIDRLTAERDALKEGLDGWHTRFLDVEVERDALLLDLQTERAAVCVLDIERDALKVDAERYRWLKSDCENSTIGVWNCLDYQNRRIWLAEQELDDAIDAAIAGEVK